ncbi:MAG: UTP--glucose-1-phosphate uridylyltransferase, partial [Planctomycetes bacterium]|nr:UTP--glucose-1-phosphate uridylyltransferase [Planctomycetota bacterium]
MSLRTALEERGMDGILSVARQAGPAAETSLKADLARVDWAMLDRQRHALEAGEPKAAGEIHPPELKPESTSEDPANQAAEEAGWDALRAGRVAIATVAGGQASRLGFQGPKGAYPLGSVGGASLFQMMAGQITRLRAMTGAALPWIIQTGPGNHDETVAYFQRRSFYGLGSHSVHFACQGTLPALTPEGQFLLSSPGKLFRNPDGHGGFYRALREAGIPDALRAAGIDTVFYCQVDNPLVRMGDPVFLGHHLLEQARMSGKVVAKADPHEKVGLIIAREDGRLGCIEYSDLADKLAEAREKDGQLRYRAGNIALHAFGLRFLEEMAEAALPLHLARKEVLALKGSGPEPVQQAGVKFETFVFDALPLADRAMVQLSARDEEFAPV